LVVWDGDVTPEEWERHLERMTADPAFPPGPLFLSDLSSAGAAPSIEADTINEMASRWREHAESLGPLQMAIVPNGAWDKARKFEGGVSEAIPRIMVFNDPWTACAWLGIDPEKVRRAIAELRAELRS
jgi:hypothetical protein